MSTFSEDAAHIRKLLTTAHTAADRLAADMRSRRSCNAP